jgi:regulator of protease activity HflC (stomatin/prohibitin superfamily)
MASAAGGLGVILLVASAFVAFVTYNACRLEVPTGSQAVLIRRIGLDIPPDAEIAPAPKNGQYYKGVQPGFLTEGRYFYNPYAWDWEVYPQQEIPGGQIGVRIALVGEDLPPGQILANPGQKGILREVLKPGRYPYNKYAELIELQQPATISPGFQGVVTLLAGSPPKDPNVVLVGPGERGVQKATLPPGTYFLNPYETRVSLVDCRSRRFNLGDEGGMDFLSADGFPVSLDGAIEFRVDPARVAEVFVLYNEDTNGDTVDEEIINKIITPESRSICRIGGSRLTGGMFISGVEREQFQQNFDKTLKENCKKQGVDVLAVAITSIRPPEAIALPVREREVAKQELNQFEQEKFQQESEALLRVQELLADQRKAIVEAEQSVVELTTKAEQEQAVAKTLASQKLAVAKIGLEAVKAQASAVVAEAEASATVIRARNKAELAGLATRVQAFEGDGSAMAQNMLINKLAPAFRSIMSNSDGPLMEMFGTFSKPSPGTTPGTSRPPGLADLGTRAPRPEASPRATGPAAGPGGSVGPAATSTPTPTPPAEPPSELPFARPAPDADAPKTNATTTTTTTEERR